VKVAGTQNVLFGTDALVKEHLTEPAVLQTSHMPAAFQIALPQHPPSTSGAVRVAAGVPVGAASFY